MKRRNDIRRGIGFIVMGVVLCLVAQSGYAWNMSIYGWNHRRGPDMDIEGQVGYRLQIDGPTIGCDPPRPSWTANFEIVSGVLPPGLTFNSNGGSISGVPQQRGHWIVKVSQSNTAACGIHPPDFTQELRFHITGTGKVIE